MRYFDKSFVSNMTSAETNQSKLKNAVIRHGPGGNDFIFKFYWENMYIDLYFLTCVYKNFSKYFLNSYY